MYGNLVGNAKKFLTISRKIYTPAVRNSDKKRVNPEFLKIIVGRDNNTKSLFKKLLRT